MPYPLLAGAVVSSSMPYPMLAVHRLYSPLAYLRVKEGEEALLSRGEEVLLSRGEEVLLSSVRSLFILYAHVLR